jgi:hypothetical protein
MEVSTIYPSSGIDMELRDFSGSRIFTFHFLPPCVMDTGSNMALGFQYFILFLAIIA